jgi:L-asparaginase II
MQNDVSTLERAFQVAKSGRVASIREIRAKLKREGYDNRVLDCGRSLNTQLNHLIKIARSGSNAQPSSS